jgi:DNA-damage-inducible protein J
MAKTETMYTRVDPALKSNVEQVLSRLGLTASDAINMFLHQIVLQNGLPFEVRVPQMTVAEAKRALLAELKKGEDSVAHGEFYSLEESNTLLGIK